MSFFSEQKKVDYQLEIEGAAAISQSEIGMISKKIGKEIHRAAMSGKITAKRIKQLEAKSDHDTAALVESLSEKSGNTVISEEVTKEILDDNLINKQNYVVLRSLLD